MKWFTGSINEAVAASKSRMAVFVVYVAGDDEASRETTKAIDTPEISSRLESSDFVAIRLESGSESYRFFAQIYQLVPVPSLFFIGDNGQPLEIVAGSVNVQTLQEKIDIVLTKAGKSGNAASNDFIRGEQSATVSQNTAQPVVAVDETPASSSQSVEPKAESSEESKEHDLSAEEKLERAGKLIELQRQQKMEKEREEEKRRELERRRMGKDVLSARQRQQELEMKLAQEERRKEKAAEVEARERVRQQIAQDKIERKQREQALLQQATQQSQERPPQQVAAAPADGVVRIQFRLPSGSPHTGKFETTTTLRELRTYVTTNIDLPFRYFSMSTSFPRRDLSAEEDSKTLMELQLVPTAVILILPLKNTTTSSAVTPREDVGFFSRFMWAVFSPIVSVYNYVIGYFTGAPARPTNREETDEPNTAQGPAVRNAGPASGLFGRNLGGTTTTIRARGNVHRLHTGADDNDENNTWNGNSTQQM